MAQHIAQMLSEEIMRSVQRSGSCHMVFPGGNSPRDVLTFLREKQVDWSSLYLYPSDERCVPEGDSDRNDMLIEEYLFGHVPLPPENLRRMRAELGAEEGARQYSELLRKTPCFDVALLGMGPDGHTASLFPGHPALLLDEEAVPVHDAPKLPPERISVSMRRLAGARERWFIANDNEKKKIMERVIEGDDLPISRIRPNGWFVCEQKAE